jgi:hypothetical protein
MKGDFTRLNFKPQKHYNGVWMQQGRLQLDADWNEQVDIQNYLHQSLAKDIIGATGTNKTAGNFKVDISNSDLKIASGHIYVSGLLCELENNITYKTQPDYLNPAPAKNDSTYLVYLDVWERHITVLEDSEIREIALDASVPDTTTRTKTVWQVKLLEIQLPSEYSYTAQQTAAGEDAASQIQTKRKAYVLSELQKLITQGDNQNKLLTANFDKTAITGNSSSLDNQLYRVEIHNSGSLSTATFKWSRDNGIVVSPISKIDRNVITIINPGRDSAQSFQPTQWVEITDEERELKGEPGILVRLMAGTSGTKLVFDPSSRVGDTPISLENFPLEKKPKVRRWDQTTNTGTISINQTTENSQWITLEAGIQVKFENKNSSYQTGDYWLIPLRPNSLTKIDLPRDQSGNFIPQPAQGIQHYYSSLAFYDVENSFIEDYRDIFPLLVNCFDKTGGVMTGDLEIQANFYVTGKQDDGKYIPGRVGIGTKAPQAKLHIQNASSLSGTGTISTTSNSLTVTGTDTVFQIELRVGDAITANNQTRIITAINSEESFSVNQAFEPPLTAQNFTYQQPTIARFTDGNQQTQLIVTEQGLIGIGIDTPQEKLHLNGAIRGNQSGALRINSGNGFVDIGPQNTDYSNFVTDRPRYHFDRGITIKTGLIASDENTNLSLQTAGTTQVTVSHENGNVGIGIDAPQEKLHLNGAIRGNQSGALRINTGTGFVDVGPQDADYSHFVTDRPRYHFDQGITVKNGLIGSDQDTNLSLQTAGTTQVTVSNKNGNVGIGIDVPQEKLHLNGAIRGDQSGALRISSGTGFVDVGSQNADYSHFVTDRPRYHFDKGITVKTGLISSDENTNLSLQTSGITQVKLQTSGNVGIGIENPEEKLHVAGTLRIGNNSGFVNIAPQEDKWLHFTTNLDGYYFDKDIRVESGLITSLGNRDLSLQTSGTTHFKLASDTGNVGVGVDQPQEKLHIGGAIRGNQSGALRVNTGNGFVDIGPQDGDWSHFVTDRPGYHFDKPIAVSSGVISSFNNANLSLQTADKTRMTLLQTNGNVGIGIAKPLARLHNQGAAPLPGPGLITSNAKILTGTGTTLIQDLNIGDIVTVTNGPTSQSRLITNIAADGSSFTVNTPFVPALPATGTSFTYQQPITRLADSNGVTQVIVTATGNVGIGTSHPDLDTKLHIQGNVRVYGDLFQDSSIELKDNITELSQQEVYEILKGLNPVKYTYKADAEERLHLGFIAENVPDVLTSPDKTAVQPLNILAVLTKAVKDQQAAIATLTNIVREQQKQIAALTDKAQNLDQKSWWG